MLNRLKIFSAFLFFSVLMFAGCTPSVDDFQLEIWSPNFSWNYDADVPVFFSCNIKDSDTIVWESSIDGRLGSGNEFFRKLSSGNHEISAVDTATNKKSVVTVFVSGTADNGMSVQMLNDLPWTIESENGYGRLALVSLDGSVENLKISCGTKESQMFNENCNAIKRDVSFRTETASLKMLPPSTGRSASKDDTEKTFYVMNTGNTGGSPHEISAKKYYSGKNVTAWIPENFDGEKSILDKCIEKFETIIYPRVTQLWGKCADINGDGTISILFTPTINQEKMAVGFFNSADFFRNNRNSSDSGYNPYSNEMDIIYVAVPDESDSNYNVNSLIATLAHEFTHSINFTNKTWIRCLNGESNAPQEEIFLDEGCSHLTESLCGYGVSGGNKDFVNYYLENTGLYSLTGNDYLGRNDSVGQRGAVCMFLYWLFNRAGGISYADNGVDFIDNGGISFLKKMVSSDSVGWDSIGVYFKKSTNALYLEYAKELASKKVENLFDMQKTDPITLEPIFICNRIKTNSLDGTHKVLPWSITIFNLPQNDAIIMDGKKYMGTVYIIGTTKN